jgi:predicted Mrr-cat superfamily restriction endonuclease
LRLWDQGERVEEMFGHYEKFDDELKAKLSLKRIYWSLKKNKSQIGIL